MLNDPCLSALVEIYNGVNYYATNAIHQAYNWLGQPKDFGQFITSERGDQTLEVLAVAGVVLIGTLCTRYCRARQEKSDAQVRSNNRGSLSGLEQ